MRETNGTKVRQLRGPSELGRLVLKQIVEEGKGYTAIANERGITASDVQKIYMEAQRAKRRQDELGCLAELDDSSIAALRRAMKSDRALALLDIRLFLQEPGWRGALASVTNGTYSVVVSDIESFALANGIVPAKDAGQPKNPLRLVS